MRYASSVGYTKKKRPTSHMIRGTVIHKTLEHKVKCKGKKCTCGIRTQFPKASLTMKAAAKSNSSKVLNWVKRKGFEIVGSEMSTRVGRYTCILDLVVKPPAEDFYIYIEVKNGKRNITQAQLQRDKLQVVVGCMTWNKNLKAAKKNKRLPIKRGYLFYPDTNKEVLLDEGSWTPFKSQVISFWRQQE